MKMRESGTREKLTAILPIGENASDFQRALTVRVLDELRRGLGENFGGWTERETRGGWRTADGNTQFETAITFDVSYAHSERSRFSAIMLFKLAGEQLGQTWIHIERSTFEAEHRRSGYISKDKYSNV